jgi:hypothetical protein
VDIARMKEYAMNDEATIGDDALVRRKRDLIAAEADGETVVLDPVRGDFLQLNKTAGRIWMLLEEPSTVAALCSRLAALFAIDAAACRADVVDFIAVLHERDMVEVIAPGDHRPAIGL